MTSTCTTNLISHFTFGPLHDDYNNGSPRNHAWGREGPTTCLAFTGIEISGDGTEAPREEAYVAKKQTVGLVTGEGEKHAVKESYCHW